MQAGDGPPRDRSAQPLDHDTPWTPPTGALGELVAAAHARAAAIAHTLPALRVAAADLPAPPPFARALRRDTLAVIAEIKRASPSKGAIAPALDAAAQARAYVTGGAAAISVLTEPERFGGALADLSAVTSVVTIPAIRKDFIVHAAQIWEARTHGASAVLLIARGLDPSALADLFAEATDAGLEVLVEVRDVPELQRALAINAPVIGVNNRNLETLVIDPETAPRLIRGLPSHIIAVAESGMAQPVDAAEARAAGADALLVGSAISASGNPASAVSAFAALTRLSRPVSVNRR